MAYLIFSLSLLLIYLGLALALHIQFGLLGVANFGVVGFWGVGMYAMGVFQVQLDLSFVDAFVIVAVLSAAVSWLMGWLVLRLDPQATLCATIAFAAIVALLIVTEKWMTMGVVGLGTIRYPIRIGDGTEYLYFAFLLALVVGMQVLVLRLHKSPTGRLLQAIRDNEELCASLGKDTFRIKMFWFVAASVAMCLLGALSAPLNQFLTPNMIVPSVTFAVWIALVLGGKEHSLGAMVGVFVTFGIFDILIETYAPVSPEFAVVVPNLKLFLYGLLLMAVLVFRPTGFLAPTTPPEQVWDSLRTTMKTGSGTALTIAQKGIKALDGAVNPKSPISKKDASNPAADKADKDGGAAS
ncbi:branched-chain amino acid ABC transporter permease [Yoonia sp. SS1-5]|uniref:Branched-chain amino acid ABC transporter permease n=1 Tax=Yoonia rhodophyticola TaxID=3137370 RepID=A0AAN0M6N8_9RHOB